MSETKSSRLEKHPNNQLNKRTNFLSSIQNEKNGEKQMRIQIWREIPKIKHVTFQYPQPIYSSFQESKEYEKKPRKTKLTRAYQEISSLVKHLDFSKLAILLQAKPSSKLSSSLSLFEIQQSFS